MTETIVAIDPGINGGVAVFYGATLIYCNRLPKMDVPGNKTGKSRWKIDVYALAAQLEAHGLQRAVIERVSAMPGQGVVGVFAFGRAYGNLEALFELMSLPITYVLPQVWKKDAGLIKKPKKASLKLARKLWSTEMFPRAADEGKAEAALIGRWYARTQKV